jgi:hypothetical protein
MGKVYRYTDGKVDVVTDGSGFQGNFQVINLPPNMALLSQALDELNLEQVVVSGVPINGVTSGYVYSGDGYPPLRANETELQEPLYITRGKRHLVEPPSGYALGTIDSDFDWAPSWSRYIRAPIDMLKFLTNVIPELVECAFLVRPSASNGVLLPNGTPYKETRNFHTHFLSLPEEKEEVIERLFGLLVLRGYAWIAIGGSGTLLERSPVDRSLRIPSQPIFAARPIIEYPMLSGRSEPLAIEGLPILLRDLPEVDANAVKAVFHEIKSKPATLIRQKQVKALYTKNNARRDIALNHIGKPSRIEIRKVIKKEKNQARFREKAERTKRLDPDFKIFLKSFGPRTVKEILADPEVYHLAKTCDPIEPNYRNWAQTGILYLNGISPKCVSLAHGQSTTYLLSEIELIDIKSRVAAMLAKQVSKSEFSSVVSREEGKHQLEAAIESWFKNPKNLAIKATQSLGKTTFILKSLAKIKDGRRFAMLSPTTVNVEECFETYRTMADDGMMLRGRAQPDLSQPRDTTPRLMCLNYGEVTRFLDRGEEEINKYVCRKCAFAELCSYKKQEKDMADLNPKVIFGVHDYGHLYAPGCGPGKWEPDGVIVDEALRTSGLDINKLKWNRLELFKNFDPVSKDSAEVALQDVIRIIPNFGNHDEVRGYRTKLGILQAIIDGKSHGFIGSDIVVPLIKSFQYRSIPILVIDGTFRETLAAMTLAPFDEVIEINARRNARIVQVIGNGFSKQAMLSKRDNLFNHIKNVVGNFQDAAVFTPKAIRARLGQINNKSHGHFGNVRGKNEWARYPRGLVIGQQQVPTAVLELQAQAFGDVFGFEVERGSFELATRYIRLKNGTTVETRVRVHSDPIVQEFVEHYREDEMIQTIDRLRLVWHDGEPKEVFILSPLALDIEVDQAVKWENFKIGRLHGRVETALTTEPWFVPKSPKQCAVLRPDIWRSADTAARDYAAMPDGWQNSLVSKKFTKSGSRQSITILYFSADSSIEFTRGG